MNYCLEKLGQFSLSRKLAVKGTAAEGRSNECGIKLLYLFDRTLCTVSVTFLIFSTVISMAFW